jgi:hypothetical protein
MLALERLEKRLHRLREKRFAGALGDHLVHISREDSENLCAVGRQKMRAR